VSRWNKTRLAKYTQPFRTKGGWVYDKHADLVYHIRASSDSTIEDVSLNAHTTTEVGSIVLEPTTYLKSQVQKANSAKAMYFNGTDSLTIGSAGDSTLSLGTGTANSPVSWSFWYRHGNTGVNLNYVMAKGGFNTETANDEYYIAFNNAGIMTLYVRDKDGTGNDYRAQLTVGSVGDPFLRGNHYGKWYHIALTWDATGWATSDFAAYVDGVFRATSDYTVTEGSSWDYAGGVSTPETLKLGYNDDETEGNVELALADVAFWKHSAAANVLSAEDIKALYESKFGMHSSGMLLDSARLTQHARDHATGSYPTIMRTGDHDFTGKFNVRYDDTNTIIHKDSYVSCYIRISKVPAIPNTPVTSRYLELTDGEGVAIRFMFEFGDFEDPLQIIGSDTYYKVKVQHAELERDQFAHAVTTARRLADAINESSLKIIAESRIRVVKIIHTIPGLSLASLDPPERGATIPATSLHNISILQDYKVTQDLPVVYPLMLASGSKTLDNLDLGSVTRGSVDGYYLENQNRLPDIVTSGSIKKHTSNDLIHFSPGESISAFDESRIAIGGIVNPQNTATRKDVGFYEHGTRPDLVRGFKSRLASKTTLVFDINPSQHTDVWFSTGTDPAAGTHASTEAGLAAGIHSGLVYFNWDRKIWEPIGDFTTGSNVNYASLDNLSGSYLATAPMTRWPGVTYEDFIARGNLVSDAGFPFATKYHATGSQTFNLTGTISHPFLVEKITYIFSASFPALSDGSNTNGFNVGVCNTILLMNQRSDNGVRPGSTITFKANKSQEEGDYQLSFTNDDAMRDVISIGKMHRTETGHANPAFNSLKIESYEDEIAAGQLHPDSFDELRHLHHVDGIAARTGSIHINTIPMTHMETSQTLSIPCPSSPKGGSGAYPSTMRRKLRSLGSRGGNGSLVAGRNLVRTLVPKASTTKEHVTYNYVTVDWPATLSDLDSPYVLLPTDSLVLAFTNQRVPMTQTSTYYSDAFETQAQIADQKVTLSSGVGKLILYGSLIRNELEYHEVSNQPLTSDAIHEALHFDNPIVDQWDVEPASLYSGSYSDYIMSGSMFIDGLGRLSLTDANHVQVLRQGTLGNDNGLARSVQGSSVNGDTYRSGSFSRWTRHFTSDETFYDSMVPNPAEYLVEQSLTTSGTNHPILGSTLKIGSQPVATASGSLDWARRFPFEASGSIYGRLKHPVLHSVPGSGRFASISVAGHIAQPIGLASITGGMPSGVPQYPHIYSVGTSGTLDPAIEQYKLFYGIGRNGGLPSLFLDDNIDNISIDNGSAITEESPFVAHMGRVCVEGFKYGIYNLYMPSAICFRRDKFGQFRDILEQRPYTRFFDTDDGLQQSAVEVKFVSRRSGLPTSPSKTHSQNLSVYATSSLPYFDGLTKDRDAASPSRLLQRIEVI
jgi:hypothetical protein